MRSVAAEVWRFRSIQAEKAKYHLCIGEDGAFLFVNSNRRRKGEPYSSDFVLDKSQIPFLVPTEFGKSFVSCSYMIDICESERRTAERRPRGTLPPKIMRALVSFIEKLDTLSEIKRERMLEHLYDVYAEAA